MTTNAWIISSVLVLLLTRPSTVVPQPDALAGHWRGVIIRDSAETPFLLDLERRNENWAGRSASPSSACCNIPWAK